MVEGIDTAAIRAYFAKFSQQYSTGIPVIALCDALDAARAELDRERVWGSEQMDRGEYQARAEAAEKGETEANLRIWDLNKQLVELANVEDSCCDCHGPDSGWQERAEAAEAQVSSVERTLSQYQEMLEAAEACIAAALALCDGPVVLVAKTEIRRALTGDTNPE